MKKKLIVCMICLSCVGLRAAYANKIRNTAEAPLLTCMTMFPTILTKLKMKDDSMSPAIDQGDVVIASRAEGNIETTIYIVRIKGINERLVRTVAKEEEGILLTPLNNTHPSRFIRNEDVEEILPVIQANKPIYPSV